MGNKEFMRKAIELSVENVKTAEARSAPSS